MPGHLLSRYSARRRRNLGFIRHVAYSRLRIRQKHEDVVCQRAIHEVSVRHRPHVAGRKQQIFAAFTPVRPCKADVARKSASVKLSLCAAIPQS